MSKRKYPRIGASKAITPQKGQMLLCIVCGAPATHRLELEVNWFRGDDETVRACATHKDDAAALLAAFDAKAGAA